jgi:iron complex transport system permease protein
MMRTLALLPLLLAVALAGILLGSVPLPAGDVLPALVSRNNVAPMTLTIVRQIRVPRVLAGMGTGGALALAGLLMQTVFRNPLAGPGVLGVTAGAGLGVAIVILTGVGMSLSATTGAAAILGAGAVLMLVVLVHRAVEQSVVVLVLGLLFGYAASGITTVLLSGSSADGLQRFVQWSFGSFALPMGWGPVALPLLTVAIAVPLTLIAPRIDTLLLGTAYAESLGVHARRLERLLLLTAGVLTGVATALAGPVSFIGVAVPHIARGYLRSSRHRILIPATLCIGAIIAVLADIIARLPGRDTTLPLNAVLAVVGVPVVLLIVIRPGNGGIRT